MTTPTADAEPETLPSTGLAWARRLLFEGDGSADSRWGIGPRESFLVLPNAATPRLLVPNAAPAAAATAVRHSGAEAGTAGRLARRALALGLRAGAGRHVGDRLDVDAGLRDHLRRVLARPDLEMAVILGPPRLNRKPVLELLDHQGQVLGFAKAAWNDLTRRLVRNEAATLAALAEAPPSTFAAPRLLHHGTWGELELLVTSALAAPAGHRRRSGEAPLAALGEIAEREGLTEAPLTESPYWAGVRARLAERATPPAGAPDPLPTVVSHIEERHGGTRLRYGAWHGDFTPWNMSRAGKELLIWDWERAAQPVPLGLDVTHFLFQQAVRAPDQDPDHALKRSRPRVRSVLELSGLDPGNEEALWLLYGLELLFRYDEARLAGVLAHPSTVHTTVLSMFTASMEQPPWPQP